MTTMTGSCLLLMGCMLQRAMRMLKSGTRGMSQIAGMFCCHHGSPSARSQVTAPESRLEVTSSKVWFENVNEPLKGMSGVEKLTEGT